MSADDPPGRDYTDDEMIAMMMGSGVETDAGTITFRSQQISLTVAQAKIIVDALSEFSAEDDVPTEVARQTQTMLMDRFGIDTPPEF
jgi:hypothetical protein